jgi:hypothetical protein
VKFGHSLVILGKPIVSRINEDHLGKKFNVPQNRDVCRPFLFFFKVGPMGLLDLAEFIFSVIFCELTVE